MGGVRRRNADGSSFTAVAGGTGGFMRRVSVCVLLLLLLVVLPAAAGAAQAPPGAVLSDNLEYVTRVPGTGTIISANFDRVGGRDVMLASGAWGIKSFDLSDPRNPRELSTILPAGLNPNGLWENEDVDVDKARKLVIVSVDPRHSNVDQASCPDDPAARNNVSKTRLPGCKSGIYLVSYADPANLTQVGDFIELPTGHTSTCIAGCRFVWTGGPARRNDQLALGPFEPGGRGDGRPIWVTDLRDANHPHVFPDPIDLHRNDGATDYSHDVQVDDAGVAWVSGRGGVRGYATSGRHRDPETGQRRWAAPWAPVLVAGGGVAGTADPVMFMHNSLRPVDGRVRASGVKRGNVLIGTEEQFNDDCATDGRIVFSDLTDSWGGVRATASTPEQPYRMPALSTWHPTDGSPDTTAATDDCSAHYFSLQDGVLASAWYSQGTRLLDVSDARHPRQIAYFRVQATDPASNPSSVVWDVRWHRGYAYVIDNERGIEVLRLLRGGTGHAAEMATVRAPAARPDPYAPVPVDDGRFNCPLFVDSPAAAAAKATPPS
jgi:hypothetical protein